MDIDRIQNAIDYIEANLDRQIDFSVLYKITLLSKTQFEKVFALLTGYSLGEYIRMRRLTEAGIELKSTNCRVLDMALKYGYESPESFTRAFQKFHGILLSFAVISVLIIKVSNGNISMVSFVPLVNSVAIIAGCMIEATDHVRLLNKAFFSLKQYLVINQTSNTNRQYAIAEQVYDQTIKAIEVKNVHFSYPHSCSEAIKEVNMTLHTGKIYALVGINGSGKTTLCHLLSGLYTPARGEIKIMTEKGLFDPSIENTPTSSFITQNMHSIEASYAENIAFNISFRKEAMQDVDNTGCKGIGSDNN